MGAEACQLCPTGMSCVDKSKAPVACGTGEHSPLGFDVCSTCTSGKCGWLSARLFLSGYFESLGIVIYTLIYEFLILLVFPD